MRRTALCATWATALALLLPAAAAARAHGTTVRAGFAPRDAALRLDGPGLALRQRGAIAVRTPAGDVRATRILRRSARSVTLATPDGRTRVAVTLRRAGDGALGVVVHASGGPVTGVRLAFSARPCRALPGLRRALERRRPARPRGRAYVGDGPYPARRPRGRRGGHPALGAAGLATTRPTTRSRGCSRPAATACSSTRTRRSRFALPARAARGAGRATVDAATRACGSSPARARRRAARFTASDRPPAGARPRRGCSARGSRPGSRT